MMCCAHFKLTLKQMSNNSDKDRNCSEHDRNLKERQELLDLIVARRNAPMIDSGAELEIIDVANSIEPQEMEGSFAVDRHNTPDTSSTSNNSFQDTPTKLQDSAISTSQTTPESVFFQSPIIDEVNSNSTGIPRAMATSEEGNMTRSNSCVEHDGEIQESLDTASDNNLYDSPCRNRNSASRKRKNAGDTRHEDSNTLESNKRVRSMNSSSTDLPCRNR
jgi:hypothetical protein